ncbi:MULTISPECIES: TetR/AcrR family transcriptional regulator [unclassified Ruegeria]|uniref:TetR/AcrR family transcriptional regulator n=1 Tax=unclassified Ruegeria TaxID=2625375 RepID=UPI0014890C58|nr:MULTISPECIES: TetR/AcrR family transcriptional regulator [unclassified Ruegeria]
MSKVQMRDFALDEKTRAILESALRVFSTYGFKKTSMDDIAKGAGMSRPALYLYFENKEAILRKLTELHYEEKKAAVAKALNADGPVSQVFGNAIRVQTDGMAEIMSSAHGLELLDAGISMASDIVTQGEAQLLELYANWLEREVENGRIRLFDSPRETARMIGAALRGNKIAATDYQQFDRMNSNFATIVGAGLALR